MKHNKKRNTAFLFEILIQEASKALVENNREYHDIIMTIMNESFQKPTELKKDLSIYLSILNQKEVTAERSYRILDESLHGFKQINKEKLFKEQTELIRKINQNLDEHIFSNFVKHYRVLGNIYHLLNTELTPSQRVELKESVSEFTTGKREEKVLQPIDSITYKLFVDKFNHKYGNLNENQKKLLKNYLFSVHDNNVGIKIYVNEELQRLHSEIEKFQNSDTPDEEVKSKLVKVREKLNEINSVDDEILVQILKVQQLVEEINDNNY